MHLEVLSISAAAPPAAYHPSTSAAPPAAAAAAAAASHRPPAPYGSCSAAVQPDLRYNVSSRTQPDVPVPIDGSESLAEAVCCDLRARPFAEPRFLYLAPDIRLFTKLRASGTWSAVSSQQ